MSAEAEKWDFLLKGGMVVDPSQGLHANMDVAILGDRIAQLGPDLAARNARRVIDVSGSLVTPGLIDLHVHVYRHITDFGVPVDDVGVNAGVTTVVDQGSAGGWTIEGFKAFIADTAVTETLCFISINLSGTLRGCRGGPVIQNPDYVDVDMLVRFARQFPDMIKGVKTHLESGGMSKWWTRMAAQAFIAAEQLDLPVYLHTGQLWPVVEDMRPDPEDVRDEVLRLIRPGDLMAHCYSGKDDGLLGSHQEPSAALINAVERGIHLDLGHGSNFSFSTARRMIAAKLYPYTISTDVHGDFATHDNDTTLDYSMAGSMSKMLALGFDLDFVIRASTLHPARVLRMEKEIGTLAIGSRADVSVLDLVKEPWDFKDCDNEVLTAQQRLVPRLVMRLGKPITPTRRLLRDVCRVEEPAAH
ncbi:MAG: amidohydrolase/deacetylase family metallohydrolase [Pseudomonadota bacterium]|nr:amidohydrolase/deacetylase family metallohydrolase [Pseudomonadota bacterium]MDQ2763836.1 amidohydrolase/deacetylase family metallohydrolase [Pseudomonadota bacterium]